MASFQFLKFVSEMLRKLVCAGLQKNTFPDHHSKKTNKNQNRFPIRYHSHACVHSRFLQELACGGLHCSSALRCIMCMDAPVEPLSVEDSMGGTMDPTVLGGGSATQSWAEMPITDDDSSLYSLQDFEPPSARCAALPHGRSSVLVSISFAVL